ncbi:hypothetical protein KFZ56_14775 [Virgibacillus sp. NKC19-3]|uniref:hypothetical protein n=1 Tax=Virgibacillus saliphilus TaxID=2831674 RepID=UPI001C9AF6A5|nr:hypothetical protein [Virgibacillus sp. NKC19-3]MBY7144286.1 hypothetical protein [Virgibacillus sp. NKC19-3]
MAQKDFLKDELQKEIEDRVKILEDPSYDYGPLLNKNDVIAMFIVAVISGLGLVWGLF